MERRVLGRTALQVSALGLGCWPLGGGGGWGEQDERDSIATIHAALDRGINLLDTAEAYSDGHSEEVVGKALAGGRRSEAIIATKISPRNAASQTLRAHCEASLRRLQTDYIDLYQVHWPLPDERVDEAMSTLCSLQDEGKVRAIGVSNHGVQQLSRVLQTGTPIVSNQLCYSLISRAIEFEIVPLCRENGIGILAYMALMQGLLTGKYATLDDVPPFRARTRHFSSDRPQVSHGEPGHEAETSAALGRIRAIADDLGLPMAHVALAWTAAKPGISSVLVGSRTPAQLERNAAAADVALAPETVAALDEATEALHRAMGANADYFQGGRMR